MTANERQIGGAHYKTSYEHWDLCVMVPLGYLEGVVTKYVTRWRKKNGIQDLEKAMHYLDKLMEVNKNTFQPSSIDRMVIIDEVARFAQANELTFLEEQFILAICTYQIIENLEAARLILQEIMENASLILQEEIMEDASLESMRPGTPDDGGHHENQG